MELRPTQPQYHLFYHKNEKPYKTIDNFISEQDSFKIDIYFEVKDIKQDLSVAISFSLVDGPIICGIGSCENGVKPSIKEGKGFISLLIKKMNLLKGTYSININLMNENASVCLDSVRDSIRIKIRQESLKQGYVALDHCWLN